MLHRSIDVMKVRNVFERTKFGQFKMDHFSYNNLTFHKLESNRDLDDNFDFFVVLLQTSLQTANNSTHTQVVAVSMKMLALVF